MNENGIVRIRERDFKAFYTALNQASELSGKPVQTIYELWLGQVMVGLTQDEILDELLMLIDDMESE